MPRTGRPRVREDQIGIKAAEQAFDVLDALARSAGPRSLVELCADTGMEPSKLHRYMVSLCNRGMARRLEDAKAYTLGPAALSLGALSLARIDEASVLRDTVKSLSEELGQTSFIYVWSQAGPVLIHNHVPTEALINIRLGSIAPLFGSATGPVFVAYLPRNVTEPLLVRHAVQAGLDPETAIAHMLNEVCPSILASRVHWSGITLIPNSAAAAAPVTSGNGSLVAVLGANAVNPDKQSRPRLVKAVKAAAAKASAQLGFQPNAALAGK